MFSMILIKKKNGIGNSGWHTPQDFV